MVDILMSVFWCFLVERQKLTIRGWASLRGRENHTKLIPSLCHPPGINFGPSRNQPGVHFRYEIKIIQGTVFVFSQTCSVFELTKPTPLQGEKTCPAYLSCYLPGYLMKETISYQVGKPERNSLGHITLLFWGVIKSDWIGSHSIARPPSKLGGLAHGWPNCACQITTERS